MVRFISIKGLSAADAEKAVEAVISEGRCMGQNLAPISVFENGDDVQVMLATKEGQSRHGRMIFAGRNTRMAD